MSHRILLVDDEVDILEFVRYNLVREGYEVFTAENGAEALKVAAECRPHLILLDMMMPVMDGAQTCRAIRRNPVLKDTMVVFLSALGEEGQQLAGFDVGADDYLTKPIKMKLLVSRVQAILKRIDADRPPEKAPAPGLTVDRERYTVIRDGQEITLPRKEFALLDLLHSSPGKLIPREEIYAKIWGTEVVVGDRTIDVHIRKLRQKIGVMYGNPETTPGGLALKYYASVRIDVRRIETLKVGGEMIGNRTRAKVIKNKCAPPFKEAEFDIMYGEGISKVGEIVDLGVKLEIIDKAGAWFTVGEQRIQGRDAVKEYLLCNPEVCANIEQQIRENAYKLMSPQARKAAQAAGRAIDVSADDFEG